MLSARRLRGNDSKTFASTKRACARLRSLVSPGHKKSELPLSYSGFFLPRTEETGFQLTSSNVFSCPSLFLVTRENAVYVGTEGKKGKKYMKISGYVWTKSYGYTSTKKPKVDVQLRLEPASNQAQLTGEEPKATIAW